MPTIAHADASLALRVEADNKKVVVGENFRVDVVLTSPGTSIDALELPEFADFTVVKEGRSTSTSVTVRNGQKQQKLETHFQFILRADTPGRFVIDGARARLGQQEVKGAPLTIEVQGEAEAQAATAGIGARFKGKLPPAFLEVSVDKSEAFVGEQLIATTELYSDAPLSQWPRVPSLRPQGFLCTSLLGDERPKPATRRLRNKTYYVYLLNRDALFPVAAGTLTLPAQQIEVQSGGSFFSTGRALGAQSEAKALRILPLPTDNRPADFAPGNVGQLQLAVAVRPERTRVGEPVTLQITVEGRANLDQVVPPSYVGGDGVRVFPPSKRIVRSTSEEDVSGKVVTEMLVSASQPGAFTIPAFTLWSYDPQRGYVSSVSAPITINVNGSAASVAAPGEPHTRTEAVAGARPLKSRMTLSSPTPLLRDTLALPAGGSVALLLSIGFTFLRMRRQQQQQTDDGRRLSALSTVAARLTQIRSDSDGSQLLRLLWDALAAVAGNDVRSVALDALPQALSLRGIDDGQAWQALITDVEALRYAPTGAAAGVSALLSRAQALVAALQKSEST